MEKILFDISKLDRELLEKMHRNIQKNKDAKKDKKKGA